MYCGVSCLSRADASRQMPGRMGTRRLQSQRLQSRRLRSQRLQNQSTSALSSREPQRDEREPGSAEDPGGQQREGPWPGGPVGTIGPSLGEQDHGPKCQEQRGTARRLVLWSCCRCYVPPESRVAVMAGSGDRRSAEERGRCLCQSVAKKGSWAGVWVHARILSGRRLVAWISYRMALRVRLEL